MKMLLSAAFLGLAFAVGAATAPPALAAIRWRDAADLTVEGRGWNDTASFYHRLPARAKEIVIPSVWDLSTNSAGIVVRFVTDSPEIHARWTLAGGSLAMNHMPATGVSGLDLYVRHKGRWRFVAVGRPNAQENEAALITGMPAGKREYALYLPLYNGVSAVEVGVAEGRSLEAAPPRTARPVVFYGTSITQGGCASRPGMAYPAIIGRDLDIPTVNLGFSGNGRGEPEVSDLLAELDASVFVIDAMPNMAPDTVDERIRYMLNALRAKHPNTPVIIVEHPVFTSAFNLERGAKSSAAWNDVLMKIYRDNRAAWDGRLFYVKGDRLFGTDGESTVDGIHPTDVGFQRMAAIIGPVVRKALQKSETAR